MPNCFLQIRKFSTQISLPFELRKREKRSRQIYYLEIVQFINILFFFLLEISRPLQELLPKYI